MTKQRLFLFKYKYIYIDIFLKLLIKYFPPISDWYIDKNIITGGEVGNLLVFVTAKLILSLLVTGGFNRLYIYFVSTIFLKGEKKSCQMWLSIWSRLISPVKLNTSSDVRSTSAPLRTVTCLAAPDTRRRWRNHRNLAVVCFKTSSEAHLNATTCLITSTPVPIVSSKPRVSFKQEATVKLLYSWREIQSRFWTALLTLAPVVFSLRVLLPGAEGYWGTSQDKIRLQFETNPSETAALMKTPVPGGHTCLFQWYIITKKKSYLMCFFPLK